MLKWKINIIFNSLCQVSRNWSWRVSRRISIVDDQSIDPSSRIFSVRKKFRIEFSSEWIFWTKLKSFEGFTVVVTKTITCTSLRDVVWDAKPGIKAPRSITETSPISILESRLIRLAIGPICWRSRIPGLIGRNLALSGSRFVRGSLLLLGLIVPRDIPITAVPSSEQSTCVRIIRISRKERSPIAVSVRVREVIECHGSGAFARSEFSRERWSRSGGREGKMYARKTRGRVTSGERWGKREERRTWRKRGREKKERDRHPLAFRATVAPGERCSNAGRGCNPGREDAYKSRWHNLLNSSQREKGKTTVGNAFRVSQASNQRCDKELNWSYLRRFEHYTGGLPDSVNW